MQPAALLDLLARDLWEQAHAHGPPVLAARRADAAPDPFGPFVWAQRPETAAALHLPEPILHPVPRPEVLVVGLNPGYGASELIPHLGTSLAEYVAWYAERFAPDRRDAKGTPVGVYAERGGLARRPIRHYATTERLLAPALGPLALGRVATYADAIPWKWRNSVPEPRPSLSAAAWDAVWRGAAGRIGTIGAALEPRLIVTLGEPGGRLFGSTPADEPRALPTTLGRWSGLHLAVSHPNAWGRTKAYWTAVSAEIARALETGTGARDA